MARVEQELEQRAASLHQHGRLAIGAAAAPAADTRLAAAVGAVRRGRQRRIDRQLGRVRVGAAAEAAARRRLAGVRAEVEKGWLVAERAVQHEHALEARGQLAHDVRGAEPMLMLVTAAARNRAACHAAAAAAAAAGRGGGLGELGGVGGQVGALRVEQAVEQLREEGRLGV